MIASATGEVRSSIFYATVLIILVFMPLLALSGVEGRLFTPIAIATIVSMAASFVVSLTLIPVLCFYLLKPKPQQEHRDVLPVRWLKDAFRATFLRFSLSQPFLLLALTGGLLALSYAAMTKMGGAFLPAFQSAFPSATLEDRTE